MRKLALVLATAATLAATAVATPSPAHARYRHYGYGPGIFGGLVAGALIASIASSAYAYGPGYGYYGGYYPAYPHIMADILRIMGGTILDITAATSTGDLTTATGTFTRPDMPATTVVIVITAATIAAGVTGNLKFSTAKT